MIPKEPSNCGKPKFVANLIQQEELGKKQQLIEFLNGVFHKVRVKTGYCKVCPLYKKGVVLQVNVAGKVF
jgi:hypothetical protein